MLYCDQLSSLLTQIPIVLTGLNLCVAVRFSYGRFSALVAPSALLEFFHSPNVSLIPHASLVSFLSTVVWPT